MITQLNDLLVVLLYESLIVLVIVLIVLGIKLIKTLKKVNVMIDDINDKMSKLDGIFDVVNFTTSIGSKLLRCITKKKGKNVYE